jgi:hypothetical protein
MVLALTGMGLLCSSVSARAEGGGDAPAPRTALSFYGMENGRFEVAALAGPEGGRLGALAEQAWDAWTGPCALPDRWLSGITVRLSPVETWPAGTPSWRVTVEPGGVVSVWIRAHADGEPEGLVEERRLLGALAEGALRRQAVFIGVPPDRITVPSWLRIAAAEWVLISGQPSLADGWQREVAGWPRVPTLVSILSTDAHGGEPRAAAAYGVWSWLYAEGTRAGEWRRFLAEVLGGGEPLDALTRHYAARGGEVGAQEQELAWQTGCANLVRIKTVPVMEAEEARLWLERLDRMVLRDGADGRDQAYDLADTWDHRKDAAVRLRRSERSTLLAANFMQIHPFYRNAAGSLGRAWLAMDRGKKPAWQTALKEWREDMTAGRALEEASRRILDEAEAAGAPR